MIGDWVIRNGVPNEPMRLYNMNASRGIAYLDQDGRGVAELFENLEPIPLSPEILERNGFEPIRQDAYEPYYWQFFDKKEGHVINAFRRIFRGLWIEGSNATTGASVNKQCEYVHELQLALKSLDIEKDIIV